MPEPVSMRHKEPPGRIFIHELLDLVAATDGSQEAVGEAVTHLYDWHNARFIAGLQLSIAPAAAAVLAIVAKPTSTLVLAIGGAVVLAAVGAGLLELLSTVWLHREYIYALRLAMRIRLFHDELLPYPHGLAAPVDSMARRVYDGVGQVSMVTYRNDSHVRAWVLAQFTLKHPDADASTVQ